MRVKNRDKLIEILQNIISRGDNGIYDVLLKNVIQTGKMTSQEVSSILSLQKDLNNLDTRVLIWFYQALSEYKQMPDIDNFFFENEINEASLFIVRHRNDTFPLRFKILNKLSAKDEYLLCLSIKEIIALNHGIIQLIPDMQRESVVIKFNNKLLSHIKFSDERAREIGRCVSNGTYWSNMIRWHLMLDGSEDYIIDDNYITINHGLIANIDRQYRNAGFEYSLAENADIEMMVPVVFTIGTIRDAQAIINQEEKREPIATTHVKTFANTTSNQIVKAIKSNADIRETYKFITTIEQYESNYGFVLESLLADAIDEFYHVNADKSLTLKQKRHLENWLIDFLIDLDDCLHSQFLNFSTVKQWCVHPYAFYGYIYLSSILQDDSTYENKLRSIISKIDFAKKPWSETATPPTIKRHIMQKFKEAAE